jgi:spore coat polysaccharide biosynthesis predicted glycosyltransferase SpsG
MGGVDRTGATIRLVAALLDVRLDMALHVVIGSGFAHRRELAAMGEASRTNRMTEHEHLSSLSNLLCQCDVGFTAGGNTLAELACVGTPALVAFEDPHERAQGEAFERRGFGCCLGPGVSVERTQIRDAIETFDDPAVRERHCVTGKALVDGKGAQRVLDIAATMLSRDSAFSP